MVLAITVLGVLALPSTNFLLALGGFVVLCAIVAAAIGVHFLMAEAIFGGSGTRHSEAKTNCPACGARNSTQREQCKHCGETLPTAE